MFFSLIVGVYVGVCDLDSLAYFTYPTSPVLSNEDVWYGPFMDVVMLGVDGYFVYPTVFGGDYVIFPEHSCCKSCIEQVVFNLQNDIALVRCDECCKFSLICANDGTLCTVCEVCAHRGLETALGEGGADAIPVYGSGLFVYLVFTVGLPVLVSLGYSDFI